MENKFKEQRKYIKEALRLVKLTKVDKNYSEFRFDYIIETLSIALDLREGSMTTSEAQAQLLRLFSVSERSSFEKAMYWYLKGFEDAEKRDDMFLERLSENGR